jgi:hypothetical protein
MKRSTVDGQHSMELTLDGNAVVVRLTCSNEAEAKAFLADLEKNMRKGSVQIGAQFEGPLQ